MQPPDEFREAACWSATPKLPTQEQDLALQLDTLKTAGCSRVFEEKASGAQRERPALQAALEYMREGDTLVVWKLDRLARGRPGLLAAGNPAW